jgi:hypothetical protein
MKKFYLVALLVLSTLLILSIVQAEDMMTETVTVTTSHVETHPSQGDIRVIEGASATLVRSEEGLSIHMSTQEFEDGHVYSMWVVIMNNPAACKTNPCTPADVIGNSDEVKSDLTWGDSIVYDSDDGRMAFTAWVAAGDLPEPWYGNGLGDPMSVEVHLVINDHGEVIPDMVASMLNTYRGGCTDESLPAPFPETAKSDGEPGPNQCRLIQDAVFMP